MSSVRDRYSKALYLQQEAAAEERRLAPQIAANTAALRETKQAQRKLWSGALPEIAERLGQQKPSAGSWVGGIVKTDDSNPLEAGIDYGVSFPTTETPQPNAGKATFAKFMDTLSETGFTLSSPSGEQRLLLYVVTQCLTQSADMSNIETWKLAFARLVELGCFADDEIGYLPELKTPAPPAPDLTVADIDRLDTTTRDGQQTAKRLLTEEFFSEDVRALFSAWCSSLESGFGYYITEDVKEAAYTEFNRRNLNWLDRRSYDTVRIALVKRGLMPDFCRTKDEAFTQAIEDTQVSLGGFDARQDFARRTALLRGL